jgi:hypothetical protein
MVTTASKFFFAGAFVALVAAAIYGIGTDGDLLGVLTVGLKGPVGEHIGYTVLFVASAAFLGLGTATSILRDADPEVQAAVARLESLPPVVAPSYHSYVPVFAGAAAVTAAVGLVASPVLFIIGVLGLLLVILEWMVTAWSERATGDPAVNRQIRNRLMYPIEIPIGAAIGVMILVVSVSRVFLTVDRISSSVVAICVAGLVLFFGFLFSYRPRISRDAIATVIVVCVLAVIGFGIVGAVSGTREFEEHETEGHEEPELAPAGQEGEG